MSHAQIPSLNGLRAVAVLMVVACHTAGMPAAKAAWPEPLRWATLHLGGLGVTVFFVISGFLITTLLLREADKGGGLDLKRFYFRRTMRIFPPFYVFLIVAGALAYFGLVPGGVHLLPALTYTTNYLAPAEGIYGHAWSLSVEEQFYLIWPFALAALGRRRAMLIAAAAIVAAPFVRVAVFALTRDLYAVAYHFETVADSLAAGCLLAGLRPRLHAWAPYLRALNSPLILLAPLAIVAANYGLSGHIRWAFVAALLTQATILNAAIALCLDRAITRPGPVLNARPVAWLGTVSYSLYLWQQPFLGAASPLPIPTAWALAITCALASYYLIERPALQLRDRLEPRIFRRAALAAA